MTMSHRSGEPSATAARACPGCLARTWLLERLSAHIDVQRARAAELLTLDDHALISAVAGRHAPEVRDALADFDPDRALRRCAAAGLTPLCRCDPRYPAHLATLPAPPAVLHLVGTTSADGREAVGRLAAFTGAPTVAIVGARRASPYTLESAAMLASGVAAAGVTVISGLAAGVDAAAHAGALESAGATIAILACAPERSYPSATRVLHRRIAAEGILVSELGPGVRPRRWMFPARNRIIAALAAVTVVVAARRGSGALLTAACARELGRELGAVPGPVLAPLSWGPHRVLRDGARLIAEPEDILAALAQAGSDAPSGSPGPLCPPAPSPPGPLCPPAPSGPSKRLLDALADGLSPSQAFGAAGLGTAAGLAELAELELSGRVRRGPGGAVIVRAVDARRRV